MKLVRRALIGAVVGAIFWLCVLIFSAIFLRERIAFDRLAAEVSIFALIGVMAGVASLVSPDRGIRTLRNLQEQIERGEYIHGHSFIFCPSDGTIWEEGAFSSCPNPNHPHPPPVQVPNIGFFYLSLGSICFSLAYSIYINEALLTLIVTTLLLLISAIAFTILFLVLATLIRIFRTQILPTKLLSIGVSILSALLAMIAISLWLGQFPNIIWWVIELAIGYLIEIFGYYSGCS